jgi:hypothetical protein
MNMAQEVTVHDRMQRDYTYELQAPEGRDFDPRFTPDLTPAQMLELGVFGGVYLRDGAGEFPREWFTKVRFQRAGIYRPDPLLNYFGVPASQPLQVWREKGWIRDQDPRGWFQWYCRYYRGRRSADDERQIRRWMMMRRHIAQIVKNCRSGDLSCRRKQRQALLHWAYDSRQL